MSMETITRGLELQQLVQEINASNLANPSMDANGYLINSLQRVNSVEGPSIFTGGVNGSLAIGTGPLVSQITRLRNSFLDTQIQQESSVVGRDEILNGLLTQINTIVNASSATTLDSALQNFTAAWAALGANANPGTDLTDRAAVVNDGVAFANLARSQYNQLETLQTNMNGQIGQTVDQINQLLQQLSSINKQLLNSQGTNVNSLLDARDYDLDLLSRLINVQVSFGTAGTAQVNISGSSVSLVDSAGAAILQTNVLNQHNPGLADISYQSSEGSVIVPDISAWITGGNLGGELYGRDVVLENYKDQVDQVATSVLNVTNAFQEAGYAADGATTGTAFFSGTGAGDIDVNASLTADATHALVAAAINPNDPTDGTIAQYLGGLSGLLANNFAESQPSVAGAYVDPSQALSTQVFATPPVNGSFTVNGVLVTYTTANSIDDILAMIHAADPNVDAVYNATTEQFLLFSNNPINLENVTGNFVGGLSNWSNINNVLASTIRMNNGFSPTDSKIDYNDFLNPAADTLNSLVPGTNFNTGPNEQAFRVTPGTGGTFTIYPPANGVQVTWTNQMSLAQIAAAIAAATGNTITASFDSNTQTLTLFDQTPQPIQIIDNTGNFTVFTGLNGNTPIGSLSSGLLTQASSDASTQQLNLDQAQAALTQLNNAQANIAGVSTDGTGAGVPIATLEQQAMQSLISYNAMLQVLQVLDQMYSDLVNMVGGTSTSNFFQQRS
jgi:flagellar hook-associated protein 1